TDMNTALRDTVAPTVSLTAPADGASVSGVVTVNATASDNAAVTGVQFKLDGVNLGAEDTTNPYSANWDTATATNGSHIVTAAARDAAGNTTTSAVITVTVANIIAPPPNAPPIGNFDEIRLSDGVIRGWTLDPD